MNATFIRRAIIVLISLIVVTLAALGYAFYALRTSSQSLADTRTRQIDSYLLAYELRQSSADLTSMARIYVATGNPEFERDYNTVLAIRNGSAPRPVDYHRIYWEFVAAGVPKPRPDSELRKPLQDLMREAGFTEEEFAKLRESEANSTALVATETRAMNAVKGRFEDKDGNYARLDKPDRDLAIRIMNDAAYHQEKAKILRPLDEFFVLMEQRTAGEVDMAAVAQNRAQTLFVTLMLVALALIGLLIFFGLRQSKLELTERATAQKKAEDENEQLNNSVINILQAVNQLSQRDLTAKAPVTEDIIGTVADSINALADETSRVLLGVTDIAGQVADVSGKVKVQADQVTQTAEDERESVNRMVESLFEATQTMNQVAALAEQSNLSAEEATEVTDGALETVTGTVREMDSIRETIAETEKRIKRLGERSQEISSIVNLINTISERTHVLALNASMQAAVAGEAGRGFAVVAEEVQRLAESSRNATEQIGTLVSNIQVETNETINTVNKTIAQVVQGSDQAQKAGEQMRRTQEITAQLVNQVRSIANASEQQKAMSAQLLEAVQRIGESTENTAQQIVAQNQETDTLLEASRRLVESVSVFKLPQAA